ncbi:MAG: GNAT family N-acetyltransferase [Micromonosporaceae bacterium]
MLQLTDQALAYRRAYDTQLRTRPYPGAVRVGPVLRRDGGPGGGFLTYRDLGGLTGAELDGFIAAQCAYFGGRGEAFEWKYHAHDLPEELPERLRAAGFVPEDEEVVLIGEATDLATPPALPEGVRLREVTARADLERIQQLQQDVWGGDQSWQADALAREIAGPGDPCVVIVVETDAEVLCAGRVNFHEGTEFASIWGGSTRREWRGQGLYRATVAYRAQLAIDRGFRYLQVDTSVDSRPILRRLGMVPVAVTVPYLWHPS